MRRDWRKNKPALVALLALLMAGVLYLASPFSPHKERAVHFDGKPFQMLVLTGRLYDYVQDKLLLIDKSVAYKDLVGFVRAHVPGTDKEYPLLSFEAAAYFEDPTRSLIILRPRRTETLQEAGSESTPDGRYRLYIRPPYLVLATEDPEATGGKYRELLGMLKQDDFLTLHASQPNFRIALTSVSKDRVRGELFLAPRYVSLFSDPEEKGFQINDFPGENRIAGIRLSITRLPDLLGSQEHFADSQLNYLFGLTESIFSKVWFRHDIYFGLYGFDPEKGEGAARLLVALRTGSRKLSEEICRNFEENLKERYNIRFESDTTGPRAFRYAYIPVLRGLTLSYLIEDNRLVLAYDRPLMHAYLEESETGSPAPDGASTELAIDWGKWAETSVNIAKLYNSSKKATYHLARGSLRAALSRIKENRFNLELSLDDGE